MGTLVPDAGVWYPIKLRTRIKPQSNPINIGRRERILTIIQHATRFNMV